MVLNFLILVLKRYWKSMENDFLKCVGTLSKRLYVCGVCSPTLPSFSFSSLVHSKLRLRCVRKKHIYVFIVLFLPPVVCVVAGINFSWLMSAMLWLVEWRICFDYAAHVRWRNW